MQFHSGPAQASGSVPRDCSNGRDWAARWPLLLHKITRVHDAAQSLALLTQLARPKVPRVLAFANAHALNSAARDSDFFESLMRADVLLRDGSGMATLFKLQGTEPGINLNGTDLIPAVIRRFKGQPMALFGTQDPHLQCALERVQKELAPGSDLVRAHGFNTVDAYVSLAQAQQSALVVLGMGMPRQEEVALALREQLTHPCLIVCGGAILDFLGGKTPRAPGWMQRSGTEWMYRLACEPRRLFKRYVVGNPVFVWRALQMKYRRKA
jgi:N-acetylglucosaminyldiphosphoundecaprenol N-acetyl-beta-D-mannosaminyltransferase